MPALDLNILDRIFNRPSAIGAVLWSLGLHTAALAATFSWWTRPIEHVSFSGNRYAVQLEITFSELPSESEIETELEIELPQPLVDLAPTVLAQPQDELLVSVPTLQLQDSPTQDDTFSETESLQSNNSPLETKEITPPETPNKQPVQYDQSSAAKASAIEENFAGNEDQTSPDFSGNIPPSYPVEAIRKRLEGVVLLRVYIAASGKVDRVDIAKSSGHTILDRTAVQAVKEWHAHPAQKKGKPIATVELLPIHYKL